MSIRLYFIVAALLIALSVAWGKRQSLQALWAPPPAPAQPIQFDNGTVRDMGGASDAAPSAAAAQPQFAPGAMRKCYKGQQVTYTNVVCPAGFKEAPVAGPPVNVVPGLAAARKPADAPPAAGRGRASLHDTLDLSQDDRLRERMMERAIDGHR